MKALQTSQAYCLKKLVFIVVLFLKICRSIKVCTARFILA